LSCSGQLKIEHKYIAKTRVIYSRNMRQIPKNDEKKDEKRSNPLSRGDVPGGKLLPVAP